MPEFHLGPGDNPIFPDMHEACAEIVGGAIDAASFVMSAEGRHAFNIAGGLHHAMAGHASGLTSSLSREACAMMRPRGSQK